ncbi:MAG TPA: hypothetical protein V6D33_08430 [Cyanophyceae cyanobacterium]
MFRERQGQLTVQAQLLDLTRAIRYIVRKMPRFRLATLNTPVLQAVVVRSADTP